MAEGQTALRVISLILFFTFSPGLAPGQASGRTSLSPLQAFTQSWTPCTVEEELTITRYLKAETESFLRKMEQIDLESLQESPDLDEQGVELLEIKITNLTATLKEIAETLKLIEKSIQERPVEYSQIAPILWLTVVKGISMEKESAKDLQQLGFVESHWPNIMELALPRIFSRILEPRLMELIRELRRG